MKELSLVWKFEIIRKMRKLYALIIFVITISCKTATDLGEGSDYYQKGISVIKSNDDDSSPNYSKALEFFKKSIKKNPDYIAAKFWKMQCEIQLGKFENALETAKNVIADENNQNDKMLPVFYVAAGVLEKVDQNSEKSKLYFEYAKKIYGKRLQKNRNDTDAILNKALILCYMNQKEKAISFINSFEKNEIEQIRQMIVKFDLNDFMEEFGNNQI